MSQDSPGTAACASCQAHIKHDIDAMIEAIVVGDRIKALRKQHSDSAIIDMKITSDIDSELADLLSALKELYECIIRNSECREQT